LLTAGAALAAAGKLVKHVDAAPSAATGPRGRVRVPNGSSLEAKSRGGVKIFHLRAQAIDHEIAPGLTIKAWGYNGTTPGPLLELDEGDRVRIYVTNELSDPTSIHWHGVFVPSGMDGVVGLTQAPIAPGKTFKYDFVFDRPGTFMYHPHADEMTQIALGMMGMIVVHPKSGEPRRVRDYALFMHEMMVPIGARRPDPLAMNDFNVLTFNGKSFPATDALVAETGDLVRIRLANLGPMDHHPIHLHGHAFEVVATDGGNVPHSARIPETTVLVPTGTVRVIEFTARAPGDWALHCHMTHHAMNQMGHAAANLVGAEISGIDDKLGRVVPGYMTMGASGMSEMAGMAQPVNSIAMMGAKGPHGTIDMGGMFTILKIRDSLATDPGWYAAPTVASEASADDLHRDGIE
jgi:FtsP/CotA-like multicopper oxidase with cupredoxin domain